MITAKTHHTDKRWQERIVSLGINSEYAKSMLFSATEYATKCPVDTAKLLFRLSKRVGEFWGTESNGDEVWAIIRDQIIITVLFRRSTQPSNNVTLRVDEVSDEPLVKEVITI